MYQNGPNGPNEQKYGGISIIRSFIILLFTIYSYDQIKMDAMVFACRMNLSHNILNLFVHTESCMYNRFARVCGICSTLMLLCSQFGIISVFEVDVEATSQLVADDIILLFYCNFVSVTNKTGTIMNINQITQCNNLEDSHIRIHHREKIKSYIITIQIHNIRPILAFTTQWRL